MFFKNKDAAKAAKTATGGQSIIEAIINGMSGRVMAVDQDLNIVFMNEPVKAYLKSVEASIKRDLPHFNASDLIGKNIDIFHKNPQHQRSMLAALKAPYNTSISISGDVFNLRAFPLVTPEGEHFGSAVEWLDPADMDNAGQVAAINHAQAVIEFTLDGIITKANNNFLGAVGYTLDEVVGKHHSIFMQGTEANTPEYKEFWRKLAAGEYVAGQFKRRAKDGRDVWIEASYNAILDMRGRPYKVVKYASEVTAQVQMTLQVVRNIGDVSNSTSEISGRVGQASESATRTMTNVQAVASGAEEMDASVKEISQNMLRSKDAVDDMVLKAAAASEATEKLAGISNQMTGIVEMIQDITSQINLLALNATIEAARAGEAGKGFAVVASEVKNLANQAASATTQINEQIAAIQDMSGRVAGSVADMGTGMHDLQNYIGITASAVEEQSAVSQEMASNMQSASGAVENIVDNIHRIEDSIRQVNTVAKETSDAAEKMIKG